MKITEDYKEIGAILRRVDDLKSIQVECVFEKDGIRLTEIGKKAVRTELYYTARELKIYQNGVVDGANAVKYFPSIDSQIND